MKILTVFYSRTGRTKKVAEMIAENLNAEIEEIIELKNRNKKIMGFWTAGKDAIMKKTGEIRKTNKNSLEYDVVVIGSPVWVGTVCPAIRTYLMQNEFKKVAFFVTHAGGPGKILSEMEKLSKKPLATLEIRDKEIGKEITENDIKNFCERIKEIAV